MTLSLDIAALHAAYAGGLSPQTVAEEVFARIASAGDPGIFITLRTLAELMSDAAALPPFDPAVFPLWGVPFAVKDNIDVAGLPTTAACPDFAYTPERTAPAVKRLLAAGALLVGKTNLDQFATGLVGVRSPYGVPRNAFDDRIVPGGSSSGSAVAVARGVVSFALGTDTAGSGRVPAALNNLVGLKPSLGAVPTLGVVPACRTLDVVSIFGLTVDDAWAVFSVMAGPEADDPYSRPVATPKPGPAPSTFVLGIPRRDQLVFAGDRHSGKAWDDALALYKGLGARVVEIDMEPFFETARILYEGAYVAERYAAVRRFIEARPDDMHPVTRRIIEGARRFSAADAFDAQYRLAELRRATTPVWNGVDALVVPSIPRPVTVAELEEDPVAPNSLLGVYTNFVNLLDLAALTVPGPFRGDGFPSGTTLIAPRGADSRLASIGRAVVAAAGLPLGATGAAAARTTGPSPAPLPGEIELVVVGAHLSGLPLNHELRNLGARFLRAVPTEPSYALYALPGGPPRRPGLIRVGDGQGVAIATEVWALTPEAFGRFVSGIPAPLGIGTLRLADGTRPKGFLCEAAAVRDAEDVSEFGGWRSYLASLG
jgi:allophanate hydrolase